MAQPIREAMARGREDLIAELNRAMRDASGQGLLYSQAVAIRLGINSIDLECLDIIAARGSMTAAELAAATGLTQGTIAGVVERLEREGFVARERDASDRRRILLRTLPAVEERVTPLFAPMQRAAEEALTAYGEDDLALLLDFFARSREAAVAAMIQLCIEPEPAAKPPRGRQTSARASREG
jgi:DNA-binding MarR family transcriptional regulator